VGQELLIGLPEHFTKPPVSFGKSAVLLSRLPLDLVRNLTVIRAVVDSYHMSYSMIRTSMALDASTLKALADLAARWEVSKAEVLRRAVRQLKETADREAALPAPGAALDWLQTGGGLSPAEAAQFREQVQQEREAKHYWWEA